MRNTDKAMDPCPFCGSRDVMAQDLAGWETHCHNCGASGPIGKADPSDKGAAVAAWNTRAHIENMQHDCRTCRNFSTRHENCSLEWFGKDKCTNYDKYQPMLEFKQLTRRE